MFKQKSIAEYVQYTTHVYQNIEYCLRTRDWYYTKFITWLLLTGGAGIEEMGGKKDFIILYFKIKNT